MHAVQTAGAAPQASSAGCQLQACGTQKLTTRNSSVLHCRPKSTPIVVRTSGLSLHFKFNSPRGTAPPCTASPGNPAGATGSPAQHRTQAEPQVGREQRQLGEWGMYNLQPPHRACPKSTCEQPPSVPQATLPSHFCLLPPHSEHTLCSQPHLHFAAVLVLVGAHARNLLLAGAQQARVGPHVVAGILLQLEHFFLQFGQGTVSRTTGN